MYRKLLKYIFVVLAQCIVVSVFSQFNINGKVTDSKTGTPLTGATVVVKKLNVSTASDEKGGYGFSNIPAGKYIIKVSFIGYSDTTAAVVVTDSSVNMDFSMMVKSEELSPVTVSITRNEKLLKDIPAAVGIVTHEQMQYLPSLTADEYLSAVPGINITRHFGIFYKTGDVTMRGLNRNVHTLLLIDGIPISIVDGGATNWNRIKPENISRIEVIKGPNSSLYGSNAMGGVVNIITKRPDKPFKGDACVFYGTYNTYGASLNLSSSNIKNDKGFYFDLDGFLRKSDGYIIMPDSLKDSTDVKTYLKEYDLMFSTGYSFNKNNNIEIEYDFSDETTGLGVKIYEPDGNYDHNMDHFIQARYKGVLGEAKISAVAFFKSEDYDNQKESIKSNGNYIFYNTDSYSDDKGVWLNVTIPVGFGHQLTAGFDSKFGKTKSSDVYHTSTDTINYRGNMDFYGLFLQDDFPLISNKIKAIIGLRYDFVNTYNGDLEIEAPSATTDFMMPYVKGYAYRSWQALSPKAGILFDIRKNLTSYISASKGFRSSTLSDLYRTGDVNKGFKLANPLLEPEYINNIETGCTWSPLKKLTAEAVLFYSTGRDFQYFVGTGDSIYTTKTKKQPVIKRENIGKVEMYGVELGVNYNYNQNLTFFGNYTYNHSIIKSFDVFDYIAKDLKGKYLISVPEHQVFSGLIFKSRFVNISLTYKYKGYMWADDENTVKENIFIV